MFLARLPRKWLVVLLAGALACSRAKTESAREASSSTGRPGPRSEVVARAPGSVFPARVEKPRIMIVGDSISAGPGCYKKYLAEQLANSGITRYEFVGEYDDDCGGGIKHSAVSCSTTADYVKPSFTLAHCFVGTLFPGMRTLVRRHEPDLVLIELGVNDIWRGNAPIEPILANYTTLVQQARGHNPRVAVMVAQIHQVITDDCTNTASHVNAEALVKAVPRWAAGISTAQSPVLVADLWTNSDAREADDCVHPNDAGARRMALNWYNALKGILK
jgi:hypothetical protein